MAIHIQCVLLSVQIVISFLGGTFLLWKIEKIGRKVAVILRRHKNKFLLCSVKNFSLGIKCQRHYILSSFTVSKSYSFLKFSSANILRQRDTLFIYPNNVRASVEKRGVFSRGYIYYHKLNTFSHRRYETADVTFVVTSLWKGEKGNEGGSDDEATRRGRMWNKKERNVCRLHGGCWEGVRERERDGGTSPRDEVEERKRETVSKWRCLVCRAAPSER